MRKSLKICHLTSAHERYDIRIFKKECHSLNRKGYDVSLIVGDGLSDEEVEGIKIFGVPNEIGRIKRFLKTTKNVYRKAIEIDADIYHLHDPEMIPYGIKLKKKGKKVIFDAHEDLPKQLKSKPYLNSALRKILPYIFERYENYAFPKFDFLIGATPSITAKLLKLNNAYNINNYPILGELENTCSWDQKNNEICYVGGISEIRGIYHLVNALNFVHDNIKLNLVGNFNEQSIFELVKQNSGWEKVIYHGSLDRVEVSKILSRSKAGVVTFLNVPNHYDAQPNKMFEYMSVGIPIITSNFPLWKEVVEGNNCGLTVDPANSKEIAKAINKLMTTEKSREMGKRSKEAVLKKYNWLGEELELIKIYEDLM